MPHRHALTLKRYPRIPHYILLALLTAAHLWAHLFLFRHLLAICGDSDAYLQMSHTLGELNADRPAGYPALLFALRTATDATDLPFASTLAFLVHGFAVLAGYVCWRMAAGSALGLTLVALSQFAPLALFFHGAWLMPDPFTLSLQLLLLAALLRARPSPWLMALSLLTGLLPLLRSGLLLPSALLALGFAYRAYRELPAPTNRALALAALLLAAFPPLAYHELYSRALSGHANASFVGGRLLFTRFVKRLPCATLAEIPAAAEHRTLLARECRPEEQNAPEFEHIWHPQRLVERLDRAFGESRAQANARYADWAVRAVARHPGILLAAAGDTTRDLFTADLTYEHQLWREPVLHVGCRAFPERLWGIPAERYEAEWRMYQETNETLLRGFDRGNALWLRLTSALALLGLLVPLAQLARGRLSVTRGLSWLAALAQWTTAVVAAYYSTRYYLSANALLLFLLALELHRYRSAPKPDGG